MLWKGNGGLGMNSIGEMEFGRLENTEKKMKNSESAHHSYTQPDYQDVLISCLHVWEGSENSNHNDSTTQTLFFIEDKITNL